MVETEDWSNINLVVESREIKIYRKISKNEVVEELIHGQYTCRTPPLLPEVTLHDRNSCKGTHYLTHVDHHASVACAETPRAWSIHLVLLHVRLHVLLPCMATPRASVDPQLAGQLTPRSEHSHQATSCFSVHSFDFGPSGKFLTRDQSRIFFYSHSDVLNIFNKLKTPL
ncbi:hypothetical protein DY000_02008012 [Brassica cretica]|uniref:Uncharacterized protein n=1 Tax=Brassica cretica TaxID=69181 RepID=A0ABQ7CGM5_BRACR|nr:hypothetical protein DY000_02008012 [Brassica cretica]